MTKNRAKQQAWLKSMNLGKRNFEKGKVSNAAEAFEKATQLLPGKVEGWVNLGSSLIEVGRYNTAAVALNRALSLNPGLMVTSILLGDALRMLGHWSQAFGYYQQAVTLERNPLSLNKFACANRAEGKAEFAAELYREALAMAPDFALAQLNLATVQMELSRFEEAERQLNNLESIPLTSAEQHEKASSQFCLAEYRRLREPISEMLIHDNSAALEAVLRNTLREITHSDSALLKKLQLYADASHRISVEADIPLQNVPGEWPLIEAMFMIPLANSVVEYRELKNQVNMQAVVDGELLVSVNMEAPIRAAQACRADMADPIKAEVHLRHWHAMSCKQLEGFLPGHFKYTQNWIPSNPSIKRVEPALAGNTLQQFIREVYCTVAPGYARAAVVLLAIADIHAFADGNGRIALIWLNRELEWAGLMPAIFPRDLGFRGELDTAIRAAEAKEDDLSPIVSVILRGQQYAREFCAELATGQEGL